MPARALQSYPPRSLRPSMIEQAFGESPRFSVGVEEEVMILDGESLLLSPSVDVLIEESERLEG